MRHSGASRRGGLAATAPPKWSTLSERSKVRIYVRLNGVFSSAELAALPRRSECAASGVAQLQGRRGDHHIQRNTPYVGSVRNADPDYKQQHEGGRRKKDKDLISQAKHCAAEYGDNCEYEQQPRPRIRVLLCIFRYPCVFCGIDTSLVSTWAPEPTGLSANNAPMLRIAVIAASALSRFSVAASSRCYSQAPSRVLRRRQQRLL
jgi:hypothetical protein